MALSLYLHIPFCQHRCSYCDFNTYTSLDELKEPYAAALAQEVQFVAGGERRPVHTIFLGGGTPSLMSIESLETIFGAATAQFSVAPDAEISMECNPSTVDFGYFQQLRALGVNRLSFGVQSVVPNELQLLGRQHDYETAVQAVDKARAAGFDNFNLDLIYGVPGQTLTSWEQSVRTLLELEPTHLSLYCLTIEPGTPIQRWVLNGTIKPPDPDLAADQFELACDVMGAAGYDHYEISNWARPGKACQHNLTYWRNDDYLGMGAGAHGHADNVRYHIIKQPRTYINRMKQIVIKEGEKLAFPLSPAVKAHEALSQSDQIADTVITQLRLLHEGIDMPNFEKRFNVSVHEQFGEALTQLLDWGLLQVDDERLLLTKQGVFLSNQVFHRLI